MSRLKMLTQERYIEALQRQRRRIVAELQENEL